MEDETPRGRASPKRTRGIKRKSSDSCFDEGTRVNPFKDHILRNLNRPIWSPTTLVEYESPPQKSWAIDQMAVLFPCDIEESPSTHQEEDVLSDATEEGIQNEIFNQELNLPTPEKPIETEQLRNDESPEDNRVTNSRKSSQGMATLLDGFKMDDTLPLAPIGEIEKENTLAFSFDDTESPIRPSGDRVSDGALMLTPDSTRRTPTETDFEWKVPTNRARRSSPDLTPIRREGFSIPSPLQSPIMTNVLSPCNDELQ